MKHKDLSRCLNCRIMVLSTQFQWQSWHSQGWQTVFVKNYKNTHWKRRDDFCAILVKLLFWKKKKNPALLSIEYLWHSNSLLSASWLHLQTRHHSERILLSTQHSIDPLSEYKNIVGLKEWWIRWIGKKAIILWIDLLYRWCVYKCPFSEWGIQAWLGFLIIHVTCRFYADRFQRKKKKNHIMWFLASNVCQLND